MRVIIANKYVLQGTDVAEIVVNVATARIVENSFAIGVSLALSHKQRNEYQHQRFYQHLHHRVR